MRSETGTVGGCQTSYMEALVITLNVLAFILTLSAALWAAFTVQKEKRQNKERLTRLKQIDSEHEADPSVGPAQEIKLSKQREAGKTTFTHSDLGALPEMVESIIYEHATRGLRRQILLLAFGLVLSTAADILPLIFA